jgi:hypothetical protein
MWGDNNVPADGKVLYKKEGFTIRENALVGTWGTSNIFPSVIQHECEVEKQADRTVRKIWQGTWSAEDGRCQRCHVKIPNDLLTVWKLHNWDALQKWHGELHGKD